MSSTLTNRLEAQLKLRQEQHMLRQLRFDDGAAAVTHDFASNDYMGMSRAIATDGARSGSTGSRLLTGDSRVANDLEKDLAATHGADAGLLFNCGYTANVSLISALVRPGDTVLVDAHVHASVWDGIRLAKYHGAIPCRTFAHNDVSDFKVQLALCSGVVFVAVESVYSMDGTVCRLGDLVRESMHRDVYFIVDEAHSTGVLGPAGTGLVAEIRLTRCPRIIARVHTFGKAMGCHGAIVFCSFLVRKYLINYARPLIYSTMLPPIALVAIKQAFEYMRMNHACLAKQLDSRIAHFRTCAQRHGLRTTPSTSHIQAILVPGNAHVVQLSKSLLRRGIDVLPIRSPTVAAGHERLRVCLHVYNSDRAISLLCTYAAHEILGAGDTFSGDDDLRSNL